MQEGSFHCAAVMFPVALTDTAAISIVGIVVSGVVGPGFAAWWARKRQKVDHRNEDAQKRADDLSALFDAAAETLAPGVTEFRRLRAGEDADLAAWAARVHVTYERLLLRLPAEDPVASTYLRARERLVEVGETLRGGAGEAAEEAAINAFETARSDFLARARERLAQGSKKSKHWWRDG